MVVYRVRWILLSSRLQCGVPGNVRLVRNHWPIARSCWRLRRSFLKKIYSGGIIEVGGRGRLGGQRHVTCTRPRLRWRRSFAAVTALGWPTPTVVCPTARRPPTTPCRADDGREYCSRGVSPGPGGAPQRTGAAKNHIASVRSDRCRRAAFITLRWAHLVPRTSNAFRRNATLGHTFFGSSSELFSDIS